MSPFKVPFSALAWQQLRPDVRQKIHCEGGRTIRLVEFDASDGPEHWCETGHVGYVLKGDLDVSFDGKVVSFAAGDALVIPSGAESRHRATRITAGTLLLMIEEDGSCRDLAR